MWRIRLVQWEDASPEVKEVYEDIQKTRKEGLSNAFRAWANSINVLKANWEKMKRLIYTETRIPYKMKESIQLVVAKSRGCEG